MPINSRSAKDEDQKPMRRDITQLPRQSDIYDVEAKYSDGLYKGGEGASMKFSGSSVDGGQAVAGVTRTRRQRRGQRVIRDRSFSWNGEGEVAGRTEGANHEKKSLAH